MNFSFPANVEREIQSYAQAERLTPDEAALKLMQEALKAKKRKESPGALTEAEWNKVREADPGFSFFEGLPDDVIDSIAAASKQARSERFKSRA
jgi:hypothetical protein